MHVSPRNERMHSIQPLTALDRATFETPAISRATVAASRRLAELKGVAATIPNQEILVSTLSLQEARDSSAIENIVTTQDDLFRADAFPDASTGAAKEVRHYAEALRTGWERVRTNGGAWTTVRELLERAGARGSTGRPS